MSQVFKPWVPKRDPWMPPDYDERVVHAVRALAEGKATAHHQDIVWRWLRYVTDIDGMSFRPGGRKGSRDTDFAEGKRFVGHHLMKLLHPELSIEDVRQADAKPATRKVARRDDR